MTIKAVLFDLDDTLFDGTSQYTASRRAALEAMISAGLDMTLEEAERKLAEIVQKYGSNYEKHFNVLVFGHTKEPAAKVISAGVVAYHNTKLGYLRPFPDARRTLKTLKQHGLKLGVVTNGVAVKQWEKLIRMGLEDFFDVVVVSGEENMEKPEPAIFRKATAKLGVKPDECIFVGDKPLHDIAGAKKAGMTAVRILKGRFKDVKPASKEEIADYDIENLSDLLKILGISA